MQKRNQILDVCSRYIHVLHEFFMLDIHVSELHFNKRQSTFFVFWPIIMNKRNDAILDNLAQIWIVGNLGY